MIAIRRCWWCGFSAEVDTEVATPQNGLVRDSETSFICEGKCVNERYARRNAMEGVNVSGRGISVSGLRIVLPQIYDGPITLEVVDAEISSEAIKLQFTPGHWLMFLANAKEGRLDNMVSVTDAMVERACYEFPYLMPDGEHLQHRMRRSLEAALLR
jgi:hypothetical protein